MVQQHAYRIRSRTTRERLELLASGVPQQLQHCCLLLPSITLS
ncbi:MULTISPECIES: hypothetical protein [Aeromonas]|nr:MULTISPECIES: hypothetical protein [Aeromonas]